MTWDELHRLCRQARERKSTEWRRHVAAARKRIEHNTLEDWVWLRAALRDPERKWFVASVFEDHPLPARLVEPMLQAAILEPDPSFNRAFVEPCVRAAGTGRAFELLLARLEKGASGEVAGAVRALYWVEALRPDGADVTELRARARAIGLRRFVERDDAELRRALVEAVSFSAGDYPSDLHPLLTRAVQIARAHPDEVVRQRAAGKPESPRPPPPSRSST